jgi:methyl-accepting chemotaxis protein
MTTRFVTALRSGGDGYEVGRGTAGEALDKLGGNTVDLCVIFASVKYDLAEVLKGVRSVIGTRPQIVGSSSSGEFTDKTVSSRSVVIGLIASDTYSFEVRGMSGLKENVEGIFPALKAAFGDFLRSDGETSVMMMVDGLAGNGEEAILSAASAFGFDTKIVGGAAGDDLAFHETFVIANDMILTNAVSLCLVKGPTPFFTGVKHGHTPLSAQMTVTKSEGNVLYTVNNQNAWEVWKAATRTRAKDFGFDVDNLENASDVGAFLLCFELGLETDEGYKIRVPLSKNSDGSLNFACIIPEGALFKIMQGTRPAQIESAREAAELAKEAVGDRAVSGVLVFDCVCRSLILGEKFAEGVDAMKSVLGDVPMMGFETYGEICMDPNRFSGFHNTTSVVALIPAQ